MSPSAGFLRWPAWATVGTDVSFGPVFRPSIVSGCYDLLWVGALCLDCCGLETDLGAYSRDCPYM